MRFANGARKTIFVVIVLLCAVTAGYAQSNIYAGKVVGKGKTSGKMVALTFDDGPSKTYTPQVLAVLKKYDIKATFFMCGEPMTYYPELVKQVSSEGHEIANHSFYHPNLYKNKSKRGVVLAVEVERTDKLIEKLVMIKPAYFRAPYNYRDEETVKAINDLGLIYVSWTFDLLDWEKPAPEIMVDMFNKSLVPGSIVLLHDGGGNRTNTVAALPGIIESAQEKGYRFVTLGEILK